MGQGQLTLSSRTLLGGSGLPFELKLQLFPAAFAFVLDIKGDAGWNTEAFAGDLNAKGIAGLDGIRKAAQLGGELFGGVALFEVAIFSVFH